MSTCIMATQTANNSCQQLLRQQLQQLAQLRTATRHVIWTKTKHTRVYAMHNSLNTLCMRSTQLYAHAPSSPNPGSVTYATKPSIPLPVSLNISVYTPARTSSGVGCVKRVFSTVHTCGRIWIARIQRLEGLSVNSV